MDREIMFHDLAMLKMKSENISEMSSSQLMEKYLDTVSELKKANNEYADTHHRPHGTSLGW